MLVDVHAHLDFETFDKDLDKVIARAKKADVKAVINNGINPASNRKTLELAKKYPMIKAALGLYPREALSMTQEQVDTELEFIAKETRKKDTPVVAIGEVGLDYTHTKPAKEDNSLWQKDVLQQIVKLAGKLKLPIVLHTRKAESDVVDIMEQSKLRDVIFHCYGGKFSVAKRINDNGWYFSIPTCIVRSHQFQKIVDEFPLSRILTETDAPFLSPFKEKRNEPAYIQQSIIEIARIKRMEEEEVAKHIFMNYQKVF